MRITLNPATGELTFDLPPDQAVEFVRSLNRDEAPEQVPQSDDPYLLAPAAVSPHDEGEFDDFIVPQFVEPTPDVVPGDIRIAAGLTALQYKMWTFLLEHAELTSGVHITAVARHFDITTDCASMRMRSLVLAGAAERVRQGRYRAVTI